MKPVLWRHEHVQRCLTDRGGVKGGPDPSSEVDIWQSKDSISLKISYFGQKSTVMPLFVFDHFF